MKHRNSTVRPQVQHCIVFVNDAFSLEVRQLELGVLILGLEAFHGHASARTGPEARQEQQQQR